jgi:magnesium chelatase subunit I
VFKPDVKIVATANPIDYTHSGKIIEPLFDRLRSHVDTHYPRTIPDEMMIMVQEAKIAEPSNAMLPVFVIRTIAKIIQMARAHHDINQDKGVSVRMSVHSLELMIGEAERTRSIIMGVKAIPRFCDISCIYQSSKFELAEMEDNRENRKNVLNSIIDAALKEVSLDYVQKLSPDSITKVKNEFAKNKAFQVSQTLAGSAGKKSEPDYESQLARFPGLKQAITETVAAVKEEQKQFVEQAKHMGIMTETITVTPELNGEFTASVTEVVLEGLRHIQPPLLERKDNSYGLAQ